eukprot:354002-Chlamydomonas_euryale.AAC.2
MVEWGGLEVYSTGVQQQLPAQSEAERATGTAHPVRKFELQHGCDVANSCAAVQGFTTPQSRRHHHRRRPQQPSAAAVWRPSCPGCASSAPLTSSPAAGPATAAFDGSPTALPPQHEPLQQRPEHSAAPPPSPAACLPSCCR